MEYTIIMRKAPDGFYIANCPLIPEAQAQGETFEDVVRRFPYFLEEVYN